MVCEFVSKRVLNKPQQTWAVRLCSVIIPLTIKVTECKSSCVVSLSAKWILTNFRKLTFSPLPPTRRHHASLLRDHCFIFPVLLKKICKIQIQRLTSKIPWAGQLILYLTVKFACSLPSFCRPASQTTVLPLCPIILRAQYSLRASCTSFQRISTNWQQKWLCVLCLLCIYVCVCGAGWHWCWQELVWEIYSWRQSCLAVLPICFPGNGCISEAVGKRGGKNALLPKLGKLGTRFYLWDWTGCTKPTWRIIQATEALLWDRDWRKYLTREQHWVSEPGLECVNIINQLH